MPRTFLLPRRILTARLTLDAVRESDAAAQVAAVNASLPEFAPWLPWAQSPHGVEDAAALLRTHAEAFEIGHEFHWLIRRRDADAGNEAVGRISVFNIAPAVPKGEIGYWTASAHTGHGYMREAAAAVTNTALSHGFRRLEIRCDSQNLRSARIPRALGYHHDATFRNDGVSPADPTVLRHTLVFSRTV